MDSGERGGSKRSRFDQTEQEPKRASRFDRRSRSPPSRRDDAARERSPLSRERETPASHEAKRPDPAAAAAAIAARISEQLHGRKNSRDAEEAPARQPPSSTTKATASVSAANINGEIYISDGDYIKDIEVNDLRNRYIVTKASTQKMIKDETGADVTTRGSYLPDKSMASASNPPLYLHVTSTTREGLEKAITKINELINSELPPLVDERRFRRREREEQSPSEREEFVRKKWPEERIPINLEPIMGFNLRAQVVGHGGAYVKHIQQETSCRVQIKGHGSGFIESATGRESEEAMYLHVAGPDPDMVEKAKELCEDLLENVKEQYEAFKSRPQRPYGQGGYGDRHNNSGHYGHQGYGGGRGGYNGQGYRGGHNNGYGGQGGQNAQGGYNGHDQGGYDQSGYNSPNAAAGSASSPTAGGATSSPAPAGAPGASIAPSTAAGGATSAADYAAQYAQYYGTSDPYAAYGGYAAYVQYYQQYYAAAQQAQQQQGAATAPPGTGQPSTSPPAPPPDDAPPPLPSSAAPPPPPGAPPGHPPPPPPGAPPGAMGYNAVPPPPGL